MKAAFHTLGCKVNSYESQAVMEQFKNSGFDIVKFTEPSDIYVINTCSVTKEAARKSRQIMHRCKKLNPDAIVAVTGCYVQEAAKDLLLDSTVDIIVGNNEKSKILELVKKQLEQREAERNEKCQVVDDLSRCTDFEEQKVTSQEERVRAYIKIQDGCNRFCSYCIIPFLRGRSRSRDFNEIISEAERLAEAGYQEIVLTGVDISDFRIDQEEESGKNDITADSSSYGKVASKADALSLLLKRIAGIEKIKRIRLGSLEEGIASEEFIKEISCIDKLCPQFHLSLQSGSNSVLKRMNRHYSTDEFFETVDLLRKYFDNPAVTTDIIVGFPGETEEEFSETLRFAEKIGFSRIHVFPYSRRPGTKADKMPDQLTKLQKEERTSELMKLSESLRRDYEAKLIGKKQKVLIENTCEIDGQTYYEGYTPEYVMVLVELGEHYINEIADVVPYSFINDTLIAK